MRISFYTLLDRFDQAQIDLNAPKHRDFDIQNKMKIRQKTHNISRSKSGNKKASVKGAKGQKASGVGNAQDVAASEAHESVDRLSRDEFSSDDHSQELQTSAQVPFRANQPSNKNGVKTRIALLAEKPKAQVAKNIERFLESTPVQATKGGAEKTVNFTIDNIDYAVSHLGLGVDLAANNKIEGAEAFVIRSQSGKQKLLDTAADLSARGDEMIARAKALKGSAKELSKSEKAKAEKMWAAGNAFSAISHRVKSFAMSDKAKSFCQKGGSVAFKFRSSAIKGRARLVHAGKKGAAATVTFSAKVLKKLLGADTLRSTGFSVFGGVRANFVSKKFNAGGGGVVYFPGVGAKDKTGNYTDAMMMEWGLSAATPVGGVAYNSRRGVGAKVNLIFMSASFDEYAEKVFVGVPGVWGVTFGRDKERGSEMSIGSAAGIGGDESLGAYATYGVTMHSPIFDPVNKYFTRPVAKTIVGITNKVVGSVKEFKGRFSKTSATVDE